MITPPLPKLRIPDALETRGLRSSLRLALWGLLILLLGLPGIAQDPPSQSQAQKKVLAILSGEESRVPQEAAALLSQTGWEALAYLEMPVPQGQDTALQQAVGDRYYFGEDSLQVSLKQRQGAKAESFAVPYRVSNARVVVAEESGGQESSLWKILYLDSHYLALDMDGLRVFFTQVKYAPQSSKP